MKCLECNHKVEYHNEDNGCRVTVMGSSADRPLKQCPCVFPREVLR